MNAPICSHSLPDRSYIPRLAVVLAVLTLSGSSFAWEIDTHQAMGNQSRVKFNQFASIQAEYASCTNALTTYWSCCVHRMLADEDTNLDPINGLLNVRWHFWNPQNSDLFDGLYPGIDSAWDRASRLWDESIAEHRNGDYESSYKKLGRVCHLVQDMAVPAHTLVDNHLDLPAGVPLSSYLSDPDSLHDYARNHQAHWESTDLSPMAPENTLYDLMRNLAIVSRRWDSDDYLGTGMFGNGQRGTCINTGEGQGSLNGLTANCTLPEAILGTCNGSLFPCDQDRVIQALMPRGEKAVTKALKLFYDQVRPTVQIESPTAGKVYSNLKWIPLRARTSNGQIDHVEFQFSLAPSPTEQDWTSLGNGIRSAVDPAVFRFSWDVPIVDGASVSVRAIAFDGTGCGSLPSVVQIGVDSTRPVVRNMRP